MGNHCLLVADAAHARIYTTDAAIRELELLRELEHPLSGAYARDLVTDQEGMGWESSRDLGKEEAARFARKIAQGLEDDFEAHRFEHLLIAAPPTFLGLLRLALDERVRRTVVAEFNHDWIHTPESRLGAVVRAGMEKEAAPPA